MTEFKRKRMRHHMPSWVKEDVIYFITINTLPRGTDQLAKADTAKAIKQSIQHYTDNHKWLPFLFVLMPDHLHTLVSLNTAQHTIAQIISPWKSYLKKTQNIDWQDGFFEHRIRDDNSLVAKADYLRQNPVRSGLVEKKEDWPYIWDQTDFLV